MTESPVTRGRSLAMYPLLHGPHAPVFDIVPRQCFIPHRLGTITPKFCRYMQGSRFRFTLTCICDQLNSHPSLSSLTCPPFPHPHCSSCARPPCPLHRKEPLKVSTQGMDSQTVGSVQNSLLRASTTHCAHFLPRQMRQVAS